MADHGGAKHKFKHDDSAFKGFATKAIHCGQPPEPTSGAVMVPISLSSTFAQVSPGQNTGFEYSRSGNPTRNAFEANVAACEQAKYGLAFSSGLGATTTILGLLKSGDHVILSDDVYGGTNRFINRVAAPSAGITCSMVDLTASDWEKSITPATRMVWLETPSNPMLKLIDIAAVCAVAHKHKIIVVTDNTFCSPYLQNPIPLGSDLVIHSVTKYINGHSDVVMGLVLVSDDELHTRLRFLQNAMGAVPSPFDCYLAMRSMKTLAVRMEQHQKNATAIARLLEKSDKVAKVIYPGLESHPQYALAKRQMRGPGGMITFVLKGGLNESRQFLENLRVFVCAESLGGVESLAEHPAIMTHASVPPDQRAKLGISDGLVRLSVGIEDTDDLLADITHALSKITSA
jgi:cystathionine gamma-lyase